MSLDPESPTEPKNGYSFVGLSEYDVMMLGAGLATPTVRSMAMLALSERETLELNAEKPVVWEKRRRGKKPVVVQPDV